MERVIISLVLFGLAIASGIWAYQELSVGGEFDLVSTIVLGAIFFPPVLLLLVAPVIILFAAIAVLFWK